MFPLWSNKLLSSFSLWTWSDAQATAPPGPLPGRVSHRFWENRRLRRGAAGVRGPGSPRVSHFPAWRPILMKRLLLVIFSVWNIKTFSGAVSVRQTSNCNISHAKLHPNYHHCGLSSNISNTLLWRGRISRIDQIKQNAINKYKGDIEALLHNIIHFSAL